MKNLPECPNPREANSPAAWDRVGQGVLNLAGRGAGILLACRISDLGLRLGECRDAWKLRVSLEFGTLQASASSEYYLFAPGRKRFLNKYWILGGCLKRTRPSHSFAAELRGRLHSLAEDEPCGGPVLRPGAQGLGSTVEAKSWKPNSLKPLESCIGNPSTDSP